MTLTKIFEGIGSVVVGTTMILGLLYSGASAYYGSLNLKKFPEIHEQRKIQRELTLQKNSYDAFQKYDSDKNCVLDSAEFHKFYKGIKYPDIRTEEK